MSAICRHCERPVVMNGGLWIDPEATGDDAIWRETCEAHDTFTAEHEPSLRDTFTARFSTPYEQTKRHNGKRFRVLGVVTQPDATHDAEVLPMYVIELEDGDILEAWPEEVLVADQS